MIDLIIHQISCPKCKLKTAIVRSFGKKGHCFNCNYDWSLKWKGGKQFSKQMRLEHV